jgi:glycosyltransferase involved in cell wall biosynthesis
VKLVIHSSSRKWCGNETQALLMALALRRRGHEVVFACHPRGVLLARLRRDGLPAAAVGPRGPLDLWSVLRFVLWLRGERPDTLLLTSPRRLFWGVVAGRAAGVRRVLLRIGTVWPDGRSLPRGRGVRPLLRHGIDAVVANSTDVRDNLQREEPALRRPGAVRVVRNRVPLGGLLPPAPVREELGLPPGVPLAAVVAAGLRPRKGIDVLFRALARMRADDVHVLVMGTGPGEAWLRGLADEAGVADRVHWLGFRSDVPAVLAACGVFCSSSRGDSLANAMLEAMAAGALVVSTAVAGVGEALEAGEGRPAAGWVVPVDDEARLAEALDEAVAAARAETPLARERREEARARLREWYDAGGAWPELEPAIFGTGEGEG